MLRRVVGVLNSRLRFKTNGGLFFLFLFLKTSCENLGNKGVFFSKKRSVLQCESESKDFSVFELIIKKKCSVK